MPDSTTIDNTDKLNTQQMARVQDALREYWGFDTLRPLQEQAIASALSHRDSLLVMPTGGGKSLCYQVPPLVDDSVDVVISPLISLMKDQVDGLQEAGVPAVALHSALSTDEKREINAKLLSGKVRLLFTSPERLVMDGFTQLLSRLKVRRFAIDEAHCISQWGHDFRPEYRQLATLRERFPDASFHAFTATATPRVREDIVQQLQLQDPMVFVGHVDRANLVYRVLPKVDVERQVAEVIARHEDEAVIVYCISRKETEDLAQWLSTHGIVAAAYHAGMTPEQRHETQEAFATEKLNVVVATVAFGMGIDRSNVRCVIHTGIPKSIEHYQQETGRAGRDGLEAECVLLYSAGDVMRWEGLMTRSVADAPNPEELLQASMSLLNRMSRFASAPVCRHRALTEYFGQTYDKPNCQACDVCLEEVDCVPESSVIAQKILSCVARVQQRFGIGQVVDVLQGANTENIRKFRHNELSTYGLLKDIEKKVLVAMVYQLIDQQVLARSDGDYPVLRLNAASMEVLKGQREVKLIQPATKAKKAKVQTEVDLTGVDSGLYQHLRQWRRNRAAKLGHAPYMVFADTTLVALSRMRPTRMNTLMLVPGIGQKKAADFGQELCDEIAAYSRDHSLSMDQVAGSPAPTPAQSSVGPKRRNGAIEQAFDLFKESRSVEDVAASLDRAVSTTRQYLEQYIREHHPADITPWVDAITQTRVLNAIGDDPITGLKPIFDRLNGEVPYDIIRLVLAHAQSGGDA